jgi:hypothetical protein
MKAEQIVVGQVYLIRHHGEMAEVRVDAIVEKETYVGYSRYSAQPQYRTRTRYRCTKLSTKRTIEVRSAAKFRYTLAAALGRVRGVKAAWKCRSEEHIPSQTGMQGV